MGRLVSAFAGGPQQLDISVRDIRVMSPVGSGGDGQVPPYKAFLDPVYVFLW